ncbi:hypothetical protein fugu_018832 [Takifugu bimaculatus]|uniref:Uncharacterized protein n=1 Tax=Takifugu bimaculatus TaxID=433685 RepID=A0A4Z2BHH0_9TELE|nr:hypothetical protein fugu_018832 [Takifugu bimaculatus]
MASSGRRRRSKQLPPQLCELMDTLVKQAQSLITAFDHSKPGLTQTAGEIQKIIDQIDEMERAAGMFTRGGGVSAALGLIICGVGLSAAPFSSAASINAVIVGGIVATFGRAVGVTANVTKTVKENNFGKKVAKLGERFMQMVEPLRSEVKHIRTTCAQLEEKSRGVEAECVLADLEELEKILLELRTRSGKLSSVVLAVMQEINTTLRIITNFFRLTGRHEEDNRLSDVIVNSGRCCQKVINELEAMKKNLNDIAEHRGAASVGGETETLES